MVCVVESLCNKYRWFDQFMEGGPLMPDNYKVKPIEISLALKFFRDILKGVCYLHR